MNGSFRTRVNNKINNKAKLSGGRKKFNRSISDDEWLEIGKWIGKFLESNPPLEEKRLFGPLSYAEMVSMMCDGIIRWRNSICIKCKK